MTRVPLFWFKGGLHRDLILKKRGYNGLVWVRGVTGVRGLGFENFGLGFRGLVF